MQLVTAHGTRVALGRQLGQGGEGAVFEVLGEPRLVAKVYHKPPSADKAAKLAAMSLCATESLLRVSAWPTGVLRQQTGGEVAGFLMPRLAGHRAIHLLYSNKSRKTEFPTADWPFLIHVAANLARAFHVVHENGHVLADVNHSNAVVAQNGTVMLIDCDSFQIVSSNRLFLCAVGVPTHTPPELCGQDFTSTRRTPNHDAFGLAVLVFQLLFIGRHPFAGVHTAGRTLTIDEAIREYRFAYGPNAQKRQMRPPPGTVPLEAATQEVALLFERAFASGPPQRPLASDWVSALSRLSLGLVRCPVHPAHVFPRGLTECPWCRVESELNMTFFPIPAHLLSGGAAQDVEAIWAEIRAESGPGPGPMPTQSLSVPASSAGNSIERGTDTAKLLGWVAWGSVLAVIFFNQPSWMLWITAIAIAIRWLVSMGLEGEKVRLRESLRLARNRYNAIESQWQRECTDRAYGDKLRELEKLVAEYRQLPTAKAARLSGLQHTARERQLTRYLDRYRINRASIQNIGPVRTAALQSWGIETAADVDRTRIMQIPGFGYRRTAELCAWRRELETRFVFDPRVGVDARDIAEVDRDVSARQAEIVRLLVSGKAALGPLKQRILSSRARLQPELQESQTALRRAEADAAAVR